MAMFEKGKHYTLDTTDPTDPEAVLYLHGKVIEFTFPLLKFKDDHSGKETIINVSSPTFIKATPQ